VIRKIHVRLPPVEIDELAHAISAAIDLYKRAPCRNASVVEDLPKLGGAGPPGPKISTNAASCPAVGSNFPVSQEETWA